MKKCPKICMIALGVLTCVLSIQCFLFIQAQRNNETRFVESFCARFSEFADRVRAYEDVENISAEEMNVRYDEIAGALTYFTSARPSSVGFLSSSTQFAPNFDTASLVELRQRIGSLSLTLSEGNTLDRADIEWLQLLHSELGRLQSTLYFKQGGLQADVLNEDHFIRLFDDFYSSIA